MKRSAFNTFRDEHIARATGINDTKGKDYAGDEDALGNFKAAALQLGIEPEQVWAVYAHKHWSAIMSFCRAGQVESEPIEGRLHDIIVYSLLLLGLIEDRKQADLYVSPGPTDPAVGYIGSDRHAAHPDHP